MKRLIPCCVAVIILAGCAKDQKEPAAAADSAASAQPKPSYYEEQKQTLTATVEAIDPSTRTVSLHGDAGKTLTFKANDEVRNLDQVKVGDRVAVDYLESVSIHVTTVADPQLELWAARLKSDMFQTKFDRPCKFSAKPADTR